MQSTEKKIPKIDISINTTRNYEDYVNEAKQKKIHIACIASLNEDSYCFNLFRELCNGLEITNMISSIEKVINLKEVGTLYPDAYLSFIPPVDSMKGEFDPILTSHISELILEANEKFIKSSCIVFIIDDLSVDYKSLSKSIEKAISGGKKKIRWLKKIILL